MKILRGSALPFSMVVAVVVAVANGREYVREAMPRDPGGEASILNPTSGLVLNDPVFTTYCTFRARSVPCRSGPSRDDITYPRRK